MYTFYNYRIYQYGHTYKVVYFPEHVNDSFDSFGMKRFSFENRKNSSGRFFSSISRARSTVFELGLCNDWSYFGTITFNKELVYDRSRISFLLPDVTRFFRFLRSVSCRPVSFLIVPELHSDKSNWHLHGLFSFCPSFLFPFLRGPLVGSDCFNFPLIEEKFGFCSFSSIRSNEAISRYILKYVGKGFSTSSIRSGQPLYTCSRGLNRKSFISEGVLPRPITPISYEGDFCSISSNLSFSDISVFFS